MPLNKYEAIGFRLHDILHFWAWPIPVKCNHDYSELIVVKPKSKWIPYIAVLIDHLFVSSSCLYVVLSHLLWKPTIEFRTIRAVILTGVGLVCLGMFGASVLGLKKIPDMVTFINQYMKTCEEMVTEFPIRQCTKGYKEKFNVSSLFAFVIVPCITSLPYVGTFVVELARLDPVYYILEDVLPHPYYRDNVTICIAFIFRIIHSFVGQMQFFRVLVYLCAGLVILIDRMTIMIPTSVTRIKDFDRFLYYYDCLFINYRKIEKLLNNLIHVCGSGVFWVTVVTCWLTVKMSPNDITISIYVSFVLGFLFLTVGHLLILPLACQIAEALLDIIKLRKLGTAILFAKNRTKSNKICLLRCTAIMTFRIRFGPFWYLGSPFLVEYFETLLNRCLDAIMTFD